MTPALPRNASISEHGSLGPVLTLATSLSRAEIALHGATVVSFLANPEDKSGHPLLWLSRDASGANGNPIRGGIPLCGPWFGPHPNVKNAPAHGLARISEWQLLRVEEVDGGALRATFGIDWPKDTERGWNHNASATYIVTAGKSLSLELNIRNTGSDAFLLSEAMHSYFAVSNVRNVRVENLDETEYLDFAGDGRRRTHGKGPFSLKGETTFMFYTGRPVRLVDEAWKRAIDIRSYGAANTVVWNPWDKTAAKTGDILDQWPNFLCVENANIPDAAVSLPPYTSHHMGTVITVEKM
jgi:glucose-6-phosphate 1-epimerase